MRFIVAICCLLVAGVASGADWSLAEFSEPDYQLAMFSVPADVEPLTAERFKVSSEVDRKTPNRLALITADWCSHCPAAKQAADASGIAVEIVNYDRDAWRREKLTENFDGRVTLPFWVQLDESGEAVRYWSGGTTAGGVRAMAAAVGPATAAASGDDCKCGENCPCRAPRTVRKLPDDFIFTGMVEPSVYTGNCAGGQCAPVQSVPMTQHSQGAMRGPVRRVFGGLFSGGCFGGLCR